MTTKNEVEEKPAEDLAELNCKDIVHLYLRSHGYDGLVNVDASCSCLNDDLVPCVDSFENCIPGFKVECIDDNCEYGGGCGWHIAPGKLDFVSVDIILTNDGKRKER